MTEKEKTALDKTDAVRETAKKASAARSTEKKTRTKKAASGEGQDCCRISGGI